MKILKSYIKANVAPDQDYYDNSITGIAYKVFKVKNGKLYPPMVANAGGKDTPVGVWLEAEEGDFIEINGLKRVIQRGSNHDKMLKRVANLANLEGEAQKEEVKKLKNATLAYRPGWHLGDIPRASQFDSKYSWEFIDPNQDYAISKTVNTYSAFINSYAKNKNAGNIYYIKDIDAYARVINNNPPYLPYDFVWAECSYVMNVEYQEEATEQGYMRHRADGTFYKSSNYQHSLAGLKHLPNDGYYRYRTNPDPETVPWVITGAIKVTNLLDDYAVNSILKQNGIAPIHRQGGDLTLDEILSI